jgi:hypothetical protein
MPVMMIAEAEYILETPKLAVVPERMMKTAIASQAARHFEITGALDFLFRGFCSKSDDLDAGRRSSWVSANAPTQPTQSWR